MKVKCVAYDNAVSFNGFTPGRTYPVLYPEGQGYVVRNDNGHERFVMVDGSLSPHITTYDRPMLGGNSPAGHFEEVTS